MSAPEHNSQATGQAAAPRPAGRRWVWPVVAVLVIVAALWASGAFKHDEPKAKAAPPVVPVKTALAKAETVPVTLVGIGSVMPVASVTVRTRVDGQLDKLDFKEGQDVKAGQLLAQIDPRTFQATVQQAEAQKARDEAQLANARADLVRYGQLIKEDATSQQTLDTQKALVNQLQATVKTDDAMINAARVQLSFTTISAPISGRIGARLVDAGNIVHAADANGLLVINQIDPIAVQFTVPEASFQAVNAALHANGAKAQLAVEAIDRSSREVLASGHLVLLNNQIDTTTGTIVLKAQFPNAAHKLWPGQSVDARLVLGQRADAVTVPSAVVQRSQDGYFAYVVEPSGDQVRVQPIEVADTQHDESVISKGLKAGDRVVVDGQYRLMPGAHISERSASATATAQAPASGASK